ncbi:cytochrome P450 [Streptomyces varsoviensis]|uniref:Cytochrome P450 FAS1 n=1 Tax=Streptomyces varsoviensis TaxID=67373 RepID=A0ABR5J2S8_9ACTN|nr:cytochrome P450 [Streptomyces varsoviensis]KOG87674.1 cytochrome P450 FAS1 [Streptomyces varsoviensis]
MTKPQEASARRRRGEPNPADVPVHMRRSGLDPLPELSRISAETPFARGMSPVGESWIATGLDEVRAILGDTDRFSTNPVADTAAESRRLAQAGNPLQNDPPEHTRIRKMLTPALTARRMRGMEPVIEEIVADRLKELERAGPPADLMRHFAWPVPGLVACALFGIPRDDQPQLTRNMLLGQRRDGPRKLVMAAEHAFTDYLDRFVARKRLDPAGDDMISMLLREHGDSITDADLVGLIDATLGAGLENMAGMLGLGTLALLDHPGQLAQLRERPELMGQAVEELLRYVAVVPLANFRTALVDVEFAGHVVKAGEVVACSLFAANRTQHPEAPVDDFDITRGSTTHVGFGHGIHFCVGAPLARLELRIAFARLLERFPGLRPAVPREELRFRSQSRPIYGIEKLPIAW